MAEPATSAMYTATIATGPQPLAIEGTTFASSRLYEHDEANREERMHEFVQAEKNILRRGDLELTSLAGYAGGTYRIGWDAGNGAAGPVIEKLTKLLPGEHHLLFTDVDGTFPNHHPDPTDEKNLADLKRLVAEKQLDFGLAFDGDGDRIGAIDGQGRVIWGDQLLSTLAEPVLKELPGATIISTGGELSRTCHAGRSATS